MRKAAGRRGQVTIGADVRLPLVEIHDLNKQYKDGPKANRDISLTVEWG